MCLLLPNDVGYLENVSYVVEKTKKKVRIFQSELFLNPRNDPYTEVIQNQIQQYASEGFAV